MSSDGRPFWHGGLRFACTQCSHCCRHDSGYVWLTEADLDRLVLWTGLERDDFLERYTRWIGEGAFAVLSLKESSVFDCVFWRDGGCSVYPARPVQCRTYPFWQHVLESDESWRAEAESCPGIDIGPVRPAERIENALAARRVGSPIVRASLDGQPEAPEPTNGGGA